MLEVGQVLALELISPVMVICVIGTFRLSLKRNLSAASSTAVKTGNNGTLRRHNSNN